METNYKAMSHEMNVLYSFIGSILFNFTMLNGIQQYKSQANFQFIYQRESNVANLELIHCYFNSCRSITCQTAHTTNGAYSPISSSYIIMCRKILHMDTEKNMNLHTIYCIEYTHAIAFGIFGQYIVVRAKGQI